MIRPKINVAAGIIAITTTHFLHSGNNLFCLAGLCEDNPEICELVTGCYADQDCVVDDDCVCNRDWWAFKPIGPHACPPEGCPLYVWIDGTGAAPYRTFPSQYNMLEMVKRGFVAAHVEYENSFVGYGGRCEGFTNKTQPIFDGNTTGSVVSQLCDGPNATANCNLGIATHGYSQGAHMAVLGSNMNHRVSATLLLSSGNDNPETGLGFFQAAGALSCLNSTNLALPRERRRSIIGENDEFFGKNRDGVLRQQIETSGYDCGDRLNCFAHLPEGCLHGEEERYCDAYQMLYSPSCPTCGIKPDDDDACPSDPSLVKGACPVQEVPDIYIGGDTLIEDTGGYYIFTAEELCASTYGSAQKLITQTIPLDTIFGLPELNLASFDPTCEANHVFFILSPDTDFIKPENPWGLEQNLNWLARIARKTAAAPLPGQTTGPYQQHYQGSFLKGLPTSRPTKSASNPISSSSFSLSKLTDTPLSEPESTAVEASLVVSTASPTESPTPIPTKSASKPTFSWFFPFFSQTSATSEPSSGPTKSPFESMASTTGTPTPAPKLRTQSLESSLAPYQSKPTDELI